MQISLKPGERLFLNGAVIRVDRRVTVELMNDVAFLLESHVLQVEDTTTPLRQLYFVVQMMLIEPHRMSQAQRLFREQLAALVVSFRTDSMIAALTQIGDLVDTGRYFDALRSIRRLFLVEETILGCDAPRAA
ncbi:flagellar biosynthesis repressor FlbT [Ancylobacter polymorphus]|uniref:Probable flagellum biosynthesis repressor protein FlbT n=1 Tax=Ancylobacter polymorphus TaxID=223390 RepID=A0ABU0BGV2_9HYPH|nr:flagellar biosynthesis repressor FlbT [Ancylobacter polymorphus]MDQ0304541.1 flagellar protein FlbT [Ancylobacter polymorphus]